MGREWVKLYTCFWEDEDFALMSNATVGLWCRMLSLAGSRDDNGRIGTVRRVAHLLHQPVDAVESALEELGDRLVADPDGVLRFRDWHDWQAMSGNERVRLHRLRNDGNGEQPDETDVTACNGPQRPVTPVTEKVQSESENENVEPETDTPPEGGAAAPAARPAGPSNGATAPPSAKRPPGDPAKPEPADGGRKRAGGLGSGGAVLREVCRLTPPIAVRERIEAVCARYGEDRLREVATEWVSRGHRPHNWSGILDVVEHGWQRQNGNGRRLLPADEAAAIDRMVAEGMEVATERMSAGPDRAVLLWHEVLAVLEQRVLPTTHRQWFVPLVPVSLADGVLSVRPPTPAVRDLVRSRGLPLVTEAMADVAPGVQFELVEMVEA